MTRTIGAKDKVRRKFVNSFARQFLEDHNVKLKQGTKDILKPLGEKLYEIKLPNTKYKPGTLLTNEGRIIKITSAEELQELGWVIISVAVPKQLKWEKRQQIIYLLKNIWEVDNRIPKIPPEHFVKYNTATKQLQLWGPRAGPQGFGPWVGGSEQREVETRNRPKSKNQLLNIDADEEMRKKLMKYYRIEEETPYVKIPEAAFMITRNNEVICFPNTANMPSILVTGLKGSGKSYACHSIIDRFFWKPSFNYKMVILNDSSGETNTWTLPNKDPDQEFELNKLNEKPLPLPLAYLHPSDKEDYIKYFMGNVGFDITLPFSKIMEHHEEYLNLGDSHYYFTQMINDFKNCKTEDEVKIILDEMKERYGVAAGTVNKIRAQIMTLLKSKMTDISFKEQAPWRVNIRPGEEYNPVTACVHAGIIPVLETSQVSSSRDKLSIYFNHFTKDLFDRQLKDKYFLEEQSEILLYVDEAHNIARSGQNTPAAQLLRRAVKEGRPRRVGTLIATQQFKELHEGIKGNTTYLICFQNPHEANDIANTYKLGKNVAREIANLAKHECLAYTTEKFIVYDSNGNRRESKLGEVFIGKTLPTYSTHKLPSNK